MFLSKMHSSIPASCLFCRGVTILCANKDRAAGTSSPPAFGFCKPTDTCTSILQLFATAFAILREADSCTFAAGLEKVLPV